MSETLTRATFYAMLLLAFESTDCDSLSHTEYYILQDELDAASEYFSARHWYDLVECMDATLLKGV